MAKDFVHLGWLFARRLLAVLGAGLVGSTASAHPAPSAERLALESRVEAVRQALRDAAPPPTVEIGQDDAWSDQWGNWGNWANAWNNWGNWGNWFNG